VYGAAVALIAALANPQCVGAMALYGPVLFALVDALRPPPHGVVGIRNAVVAAPQALDSVDKDTPVRHFIDSWT